jgi:hypothetical protein
VFLDPREVGGHQPQLLALPAIVRVGVSGCLARAGAIRRQEPRRALRVSVQLPVSLAL